MFTLKTAITLRVALIALMAFFCINSNAQCLNADFSEGNFNNWQGRTGSCCPINTPTNGIVAGRHTIMTGAGMDPNTCNNVPVVSPGSTFSARLGNSGTGSQAEKLLYTFTVTPQSSLIIYKYAVVLQNPSAHAISEQPRFEVQVRLANGAPIPCTYYQVAATSNLPGFQNCNGVVYKNWTTVGVDVAAYVGQTVTLEFATGDCDLGAHYGYAYVEAYCSPLQIDARYCLNNSQGVLTAPTGFSYLWSTGETTQSITINNPAQGQLVSCTITSVTGCTATLNTVLSPSEATANFTNTNNCMGNATFSNTSVMINGSVGGYLWDFGDGTTDTTTNPVHTYTSPGNYTITLIAENDIGCTDTISYPVSIFPTPVAAFATTANVCLGQATTLTDQSTMQQGNINQWTWDLGDGSAPVNSQNGTYIYPDTGAYTVTLIVSDGGNCPDTTTQQVNVKAPPVAAFATADVCLGAACTFTDQSVTGWGNITYSWNFGDGTGTSSAQSPTYTYGNTGSFGPTLIITQTGPNISCSDTVLMPVNIYAVPAAAFTSDQYLCLGEETAFTNTTTISTGEPMNYAWDFGDTNTSTQTSPTHTYANYGAFTATLIVTTDKGCADTVSAPQNIYPIPSASITPNNVTGCQPLDVNFTGQGSVAQGNITGYNWGFGNGNTSTAQNPATQFANAGFYNTILVVESGDANNTCYDTAYSIVEVYPVPVAAFNTTDNCFSVNTQFTDVSTVSSGWIQDFAWDFGDGTGTSTNQNPTYLYNAAGVYNIDLIVTTNHGCADTITQPVEIFELPAISFTAVDTAGCAPIVIQFVDQATVNGGTVVSWLWDFGDGNISTDQHPVHTYENSGDYTVTLQVTTNQGCTDSVQYINYIISHPLPVAQFIAQPMMLDELNASNVGIEITNQSQGATVYDWTLGDGNTSNDFEPQVTYANAGTYTITLHVENQWGCVDQISENIVVNPVFTFYVPTAFTPNSDHKNESFGGVGTNIAVYQMNIFNRWGERIFTSFDMDHRWDGSINNSRVQDEVYIYDCRIVDIMGGEHIYRGTVTLIK